MSKDIVTERVYDTARNALRVYDPFSSGGGGGGTTPASTAALSTLLASTLSQLVLDENATRLSAKVFNFSDDPLLIAYGPISAPTLFSEYVFPNSNWTMDYPYTGKISAVSLGSSGGLLIITELLP